MEPYSDDEEEEDNENHTMFDLGESLLSPPILPDMLNSDSPCLWNRQDDYDFDLGFAYSYDDGADVFETCKMKMMMIIIIMIFVRIIMTLMMIILILFIMMLIVVMMMIIILIIT